MSIENIRYYILLP